MNSITLLLMVILSCILAAQAADTTSQEKTLMIAIKKIFTALFIIFPQCVWNKSILKYLSYMSKQNKYFLLKNILIYVYLKIILYIKYYYEIIRSYFFDI